MTTQPGGRYVPTWTVADRLRKVRREVADLTQARFAERLGIEAQRYAAWESGRNKPPMDDFISVAKRIELAFRVPAEWTLGLDVHDGPQPEGPGTVDERARRDSNPKPSDPKVLVSLVTRAA